MSHNPIPNQAVGKLRYPTPTSTPTLKQRFKHIARTVIEVTVFIGVGCLAFTGAYALLVP